MVRKKRGRLALLSSVLLVTTLLSGCFGTDKEVLEAQIVALQKANDTLQSTVSSGQTQSFKSSLIDVQGTGDLEYMTIDNIIKFPNDLGIRDTDADVTTSQLRIGSAFTFSPSNNWLVKTDGGVAYFSHSQKLWGTIKGIKVDTGVYETPRHEDSLAGIDNLLSGQPITNQKKRKIYMGDYQTGYLVSGDMTVDKKKYVVNVGSLIYGEYGSLFLFVYEDNQSGVQQELIDLLIGSGTYGDSKIILQ